MIPKTLIAAAAFAVPAALAAPAQADHSSAQCEFLAVPVAESTTFVRYRGVIVGSVTGSPGETVTIWCTVSTATGVVGGAPAASGTTNARTTGQIDFRTAPLSTILVCAHYTDSHGPHEDCSQV